MTPLVRAVQAAVCDTDLGPQVVIDEAEMHVSPSRAGVWTRAWVLLDWEAILPHLAAVLAVRYRAAITALPAVEKNVFLLHRMGGLPLSDIAAHMQCDAKTCEAALARALAILAHHLNVEQGA